MPKVSVIIPVFRVEKYIERCAISLFSQTLDDIEFIFIDDCTPDNSMEILNDVVHRFPNRISQVIIHRMENNSGQAKVREWGIRNAKGAYIIHCDSDDWIAPSAYETMYEVAQKNGSDMVFCDYYETDGVNHVYKSCDFSSKTKDEYISEIIKGKAKASLWMTLIKRSMFDDTRFVFPKGDMTEDYTIILQSLAISNKISYINQAYYYYFINNTSITRVVSERNCYKKFCDCKSNTALLETFFNNYYNNSFSREFELRKLDGINMLLPTLYKPYYLKLWKRTYPRLFVNLLSSGVLSCGDKIKILITYIGFYPIYHLIRGYRFAK